MYNFKHKDCQLNKVEYFNGFYNSKKNEKNYCIDLYRDGKVQNNVKDDFIVLHLKDKDGNRYREEIRKPDFYYYVYSDKSMINYVKPQKYVPRENVREIKCKYSNLMGSMVKELDNTYFTDMFNLFKQGNGGLRSELMDGLNQNLYFHGTDVPIKDYYIWDYLSQYSFQDHDYGLDKLHFDIEVDSSKIIGFPDPREATCPVNACSLVDSSKMTVYEYLLDYKGFDQCESLKNDIEEFTKMIEAKYDGEFKVIIKFFDNELDLIRAIFKTIHKLQPDYAGAWNADFDMQTLVNRAKRLVGIPLHAGRLDKEQRVKLCDILCPDFYYTDEEGNLRYLDNGYDLFDVSLKIDNNPDFSAKHCFYNISGYTNFIDEQALYANITKPMGKEDSYSLDYIGQKVTGMAKEEHEENMKNFHFENYRKFVEYSIQDSVLLHFIEKKKSFIDLLHTISMLTYTTVENSLKKTVALKNLARVYGLEAGYVQSNNRSRTYYKSGEKIKGAYVADPENIDHVGMEVIEGVISNKLLELVIDLDLSSLYPSIIRALNVTYETMIGKIELLDSPVPMEDGAEFIQDFISHDVLNIGHKYFNLPSVDDMIDVIEKEVYATA